VAGQVHVLSPSGDIEVITATRPKERQKRHARKYAEGELGEDRSFYFRGPEKALNLRAHNLTTSCRWPPAWTTGHGCIICAAASIAMVRDAIKDEDLADEATEVESDRTLSPKDSRARIKQMIERRYMVPARS